MRREKLIRLRKSKGYTQEDVAKVIGVTRGCYCNIENGVSDPSMKIGFKIIKFLGTNFDIFFDIDDTGNIKIS